MSLFIFAAFCSAVLVFIALRLAPAQKDLSPVLLDSPTPPTEGTPATSSDAAPPQVPKPTVSAETGTPTQTRPSRLPSTFWIIGGGVILIAFAFIVWAASQEARYEVRFALVIFDFIRDSDNGEVLLVWVYVRDFLVDLV